MTSTRGDCTRPGERSATLIKGRDSHRFGAEFAVESDGRGVIKEVGLALAAVGGAEQNGKMDGLGPKANEARGAKEAACDILISVCDQKMAAAMP